MLIDFCCFNKTPEAGCFIKKRVWKLRICDWATPSFQLLVRVPLSSQCGRETGREKLLKKKQILGDGLALKQPFHKS